MKGIIVAALAVLAATAMAAPAPEPRWHNHCHFRGQPCWKAKRAVEDLEDASKAFEALGDLEKRHNHCYFRGQPCWKVKRAVEDITLANEALDNYSGNATLDKRHNHCYFRGQPCWKVKRAVEVVEEATPADKAADKTAAVGTSPIIPETVAAVEQLMEENFTDNPVLEKRHNHCYFRGQPCWKAKRAIESFEEK